MDRELVAALSPALWSRRADLRAEPSQAGAARCNMLQAIYGGLILSLYCLRYRLFYGENPPK